MIFNDSLHLPQVTVRPPIVSHAEKEPLPPSGSPFVGKAEPSKPSRVKGGHPASSHKEIEPSSSSSILPAKATIGASHASATPSSSVTVERTPSLVSGSAGTDGSVSVSTSSTDDARAEAVRPDSLKDKTKRPGSRGRQEQVICGLLLSVYNFWAGFTKPNLPRVINTNFALSSGAQSLCFYLKFAFATP